MITKETAIRLFNDRKIRTHWDDNREKWYFSIVDVVGVLTDSPNLNNYWKFVKLRLIKEGSELVANCNQLKMLTVERKIFLVNKTGNIVIISFFGHVIFTLCHFVHPF